MDYIDLPPLTHAQGRINLPGSKSISNRVLLLAALSQGKTTVHGLLDSDDTSVMLAALQALGIVVEKVGEHSVVVHGQSTFPTQQADLFMGNAGTAIRPLTAVLATMDGHYHLHGVPRMHERPIGDLVDALNAVGAQIRYEGQVGYPPLYIEPPCFTQADHIEVDGSVSSQFLTAILMASPLLAKRLGKTIHIHVKGELISKPYIQITLNLMKKFGVQVQQTGWSSFSVPSQAQYQSPQTIYVEGDASSASYFLALGLLGQGPIQIHGVSKNSIQGDIRFADFVQSLGAHIDYAENNLTVRGLSNQRLPAFDADFNLIPDAAMTAAVLALFADGPCTLRNIASWRVKETDRIQAMQQELSKLGASVQAGPDYLTITPPQTWQCASIHTYDDHRMAMCFSLAAFGGQAVRILDPHCVAKTYPHYFDDFLRLVS